MLACSELRGGILPHLEEDHAANGSGDSKGVVNLAMYAWEYLISVAG